jgi:hypothetical protein
MVEVRAGGVREGARWREVVCGRERGRDDRGSWRGMTSRQWWTVMRGRGREGRMGGMKSGRDERVGKR